MTSANWIDTSSLAGLANLSPQAVRKAVRKSLLIGREWRGAQLVATEHVGSAGGGRAGCHYLVRIDSLPLALQLRLEARETALQTSFNRTPTDKAAEAASWWWEFLRPALSHPKRSPERAAVMRDLAGQRVCGPHGEWFTPSLRDIERKAGRATAAGLKGLMRKPREDDPEKGVILTRRWDAATAMLSRAESEEIARKARQRIRDLWGSGAVYSDVRRLAGEHLAGLMRSAAVRPDAPDLAQLQEIVRRKDHAADAVREHVHEAWALSYLATHSLDGSRTDYSAERHHEAACVVMEHIALLMEAAKGCLDVGHSGARHAVLDGREDAP